MKLPGRFYSIVFGVITLLAALFAVLHGGWDLYDRLFPLENTAKVKDQSSPIDVEELTVPQPTNFASRVTARLACDNLVLSNIVFDSRETPETKTASGHLGHYLAAQLDATLAGQTRLISAEGNGKGPGAEANAAAMLVEHLAQRLKTTFPKC